MFARFSHQEELQLQVEALRLSLTQIHSSQLELVQLEAEEKDAAVRDLTAQLDTLQAKLRDLQAQKGGADAAASGSCYSPSCSGAGAGGGGCYSPTCSQPSPTTATGVPGSSEAALDHTSDSSNVPAPFVRDSFTASDGMFADVPHGTDTNIGDSGSPTASADAAFSLEAALMEDHTSSSLVQTAEAGGVHDIAANCYSPSCLHDACYSSTCPNLQTGDNFSGAKENRVNSSPLAEHAVSHSVAVHGVSACYSPSCDTNVAGGDQHSSCYSPVCASRRSSAESADAEIKGSGSGGGNEEGSGHQNPAEQDAAGGFGDPQAPSCHQGDDCTSPFCEVHFGSNDQGAGDLLVDFLGADTPSSEAVQPSLNPFSAGLLDVGGGGEGQIDWNAMHGITSLHESMTGTLNSSSHLVDTQDSNPFGSFATASSTNPFGADFNPFSSSESQSLNPFHSPVSQSQDFDPFSVSGSKEPLVQTFASDFDPFTPQATLQALSQSKESSDLADVFSSDIRDSGDFGTAELSDNVFVSSGPRDSTDSHTGSKLVGESDTGDLGDMKSPSEVQKEVSVQAGEPRSPNPVSERRDTDDSSFEGFGSPFGTTGSEDFSDLDHVREYAKMMEERERGSDDESSEGSGGSVDRSRDSRTQDPDSALIDSSHTPVSTQGTGELPSEEQKGAADTGTNSDDRGGMGDIMQTFDQLKIGLGSLGRVNSADLLEVDEPAAQSSSRAETEEISQLSSGRDLNDSAKDLGDSDFMGCATSSSYSYTPNQLSSREFLKSSDLEETGEEMQVVDGGDARSALATQLSDANRSFSETFHETHEEVAPPHEHEPELDSQEDGDSTTEEGAGAKMGAESGEMMETSDMVDTTDMMGTLIDTADYMPGISKMDTLPIRGPGAQDEAMEVLDEDVEYVETPRSDQAVSSELNDEDDRDSDTGSNGSEEALERTEKIIKMLESGEFVPNQHLPLRKSSSVLGDEDVAAMSGDAHTYRPSPDINEAGDHLALLSMRSSVDATKEDQEVVQSADMDLSSEDLHALKDNVNLKNRDDFDRRPSHDGFEVDTQENNGVLFKISSTVQSESDESPDEIEEEPMDMENEETEKKPDTPNSPSKEKTVTFRDTIEFMEIDNAVFDVSLDGSLKPARTENSEEENSDEDTSDPFKRTGIFQAKAMLSDEVENEESPRTGEEEPLNVRDSVDSNDGKVGESADEDVSYESDYSEDINTSSSSTDNPDDKETRLKRTQSESFDETVGSDSEKESSSTSSGEKRKHQDLKNVHQESEESSVPEEIPEEINFEEESVEDVEEDDATDDGALLDLSAFSGGEHKETGREENLDATYTVEKREVSGDLLETTGRGSSSDFPDSSADFEINAVAKMLSNLEQYSTEVEDTEDGQTPRTDEPEDETYEYGAAAASATVVDAFGDETAEVSDVEYVETPREETSPRSQREGTVERADLSSTYTVNAENLKQGDQKEGSLWATYTVQHPGDEIVSFDDGENVQTPRSDSSATGLGETFTVERPGDDSDEAELSATPTEESQPTIRTADKPRGNDREDMLRRSSSDSVSDEIEEEIEDIDDVEDLEVVDRNVEDRLGDRGLINEDSVDENTDELEFSAAEHDEMKLSSTFDVDALIVKGNVEQTKTPRGETDASDLDSHGSVSPPQTPREESDSDRGSRGSDSSADGDALEASRNSSLSQTPRSARAGMFPDSDGSDIHRDSGEEGEKEVETHPGATIIGDQSETPRSAGRVVGGMFAETESSDSEQSGETDSNIPESEKQDSSRSKDTLGHSLSSTLGSQTSDVPPINDDRFGRTYEVLRGDDDDVEYIERWHGDVNAAAPPRTETRDNNMDPETGSYAFSMQVKDVMTFDEDEDQPSSRTEDIVGGAGGYQFSMDVKDTFGDVDELEIDKHREPEKYEDESTNATYKFGLEVKSAAGHVDFTADKDGPDATEAVQTPAEDDEGERYNFTVEVKDAVGDLDELLSEEPKNTTQDTGDEANAYNFSYRAEVEDFDVESFGMASTTKEPVSRDSEENNFEFSASPKFGSDGTTVIQKQEAEVVSANFNESSHQVEGVGADFKSSANEEKVELPWSGRRDTDEDSKSAHDSDTVSDNAEGDLLGDSGNLETVAPKSQGQGRVVGSMYADSDSDESNTSEDDELSSRGSNQEVPPVVGSNHLSANADQASEENLLPFNDDKFGRRYEVLHGDDDDVEYIERWHGDPKQNTAEQVANVGLSPPVNGINGAEQDVEEIEERNSPVEEVQDNSDDELGTKSGSDEGDNDFLEDMLNVSAESRDREDQSLDFSDGLAVRVAVETTSAEQNKDSDGDDEVFVESDLEEDVYGGKPYGDFEEAVESKGKVASGPKLKNFLVSGLDTNEDFRSDSVLPDDFDVNQVFVAPSFQSVPSPTPPEKSLSQEQTNESTSSTKEKSPLHEEVHARSEKQSSLVENKLVDLIRESEAKGISQSEVEEGHDVSLPFKASAAGPTGSQGEQKFLSENNNYADTSPDDNHKFLTETQDGGVEALQGSTRHGYDYPTVEAAVDDTDIKTRREEFGSGTNGEEGHQFSPDRSDAAVESGDETIEEEDFGDAEKVEQEKAPITGFDEAPYSRTFTRADEDVAPQVRQYVEGVIQSASDIVIERESQLIVETIDKTSAIDPEGGADEDAAESGRKLLIDSGSPDRTEQGKKGDEFETCIDPQVERVVAVDFSASRIQAPPPSVLVEQHTEDLPAPRGGKLRVTELIAQVHLTH